MRYWIDYCILTMNDTYFTEKLGINAFTSMNTERTFHSLEKFDQLNFTTTGLTYRSYTTTIVVYNKCDQQWCQNAIVYVYTIFM